MILAPILFLQVPLRSSSDDLTARGNLTIIGAVTRPHAPPENSARDLTHSTRLHAPPGFFTRLHALPRAVTHQGPLADVSPSDVIIATSFADVTATSSLTRTLTRPLTIVDFDLRLTLTVDFLPELTFCSPGAPYPVFRVDFIFAVYFCIFCF